MHGTVHGLSAFGRLNVIEYIWPSYVTASAGAAAKRRDRRRIVCVEVKGVVVARCGGMNKHKNE